MLADNIAIRQRWRMPNRFNDEHRRRRPWKPGGTSLWQRQIIAVMGNLRLAVGLPLEAGDGSEVCLTLTKD